MKVKRLFVLFFMTLFSCAGSTPVKVTDKDVIDYLTEAMGLGKPDGFRISSGLDLMYYRSNRFYRFQRSLKQWVFVGMGYIKPPRPSIDEVTWSLTFARAWWERQKELLSNKKLLEEKESIYVLQEKEKK